MHWGLYARGGCDGVEMTVFEVFDGLFKGKFELWSVAGYFDGVALMTGSVIGYRKTGVKIACISGCGSNQVVGLVSKGYLLRLV